MPPENAPNSQGDLPSLRSAIDRIDGQVVELLNERAAIVQRIGDYKRGSGVPIYAPHRESEVLARVLERSKGPLPQRTIEAIYKELMSGSFALEQPLRIGYLGPPGSFSHVASVRQFGSSVEHDPLDRIGSVFTEVRHGHIDYGLVPIENSIFGGITETLDEFIVAKGEVTVYAEVQIEVHHTMLSHCEAPKIRRIHSKPEVFGQCRNWLMRQFPHAELVPEASSSRAAQLVAEQYAAHGDSCGSAAIGSTLAGQVYSVPVLFERVEDNPNTITRFFVISRQKTAPSGDDKTSIMFITADRPGALVEVLGVFHRAGVNLSHIEKRPSGRTNWHYTFFIDALGHRDDASMQQALDEASRLCQELTVLGSFPRATRIL